MIKPAKNKKNLYKRVAEAAEGWYNKGKWMEKEEKTAMEYVEKKRWAFLGLPLTFTKYKITEEIITVDSGLLKKVENDCYMYKVVDVRLEVSLLERIFGLGTVHCFSGDLTNPDLRLLHIKRAKEIKDFILKQSEEERLKRKTLNTQRLDGVPGSGAGDSCED